jgi:predicted DNA-binding transcriptional regulator AlpA
VNTTPGPPPRTPGDRLLSAAEVAQILGGNVTRNTVIRRRKNWQLPAHRIGKQLRWWQSDVYDWIGNRAA